MIRDINIAHTVQSERERESRVKIFQECIYTHGPRVIPKPHTRSLNTQFPETKEFYVLSVGSLFKHIFGAGNTG